MDSSPDKPKLKLLLVAYDFPPVASAGMPRIVGMAKYLARAGWDITVLTVKSTFGNTSQESLELVPHGIRVIRTRTFEIRALWKSSMKRLGEEWTADAGWQPRSKGVRKLGVSIVDFCFRILDRMSRFPDLKAGWFLPLFYRGWRVIRNSHYDVVLSSSPPHSLQFALFCLRLLVPFKWVTDWRDPWTIPLRPTAVGMEFRVKRLMEKKIIAKCDFVVANTPGNMKALAREMGEEWLTKATVITNGLDLELDENKKANHRLRLECDIVYVGEIYAGMLDVYVEALRFMRENGRGPIPTLWVYGQSPRASSVSKIKEYELEKWVSFKGRVPLSVGRAIIKSASALLVLVPHGEGFETWVPSKLYSYLFSPAPILALVPQGDVAEIVERTGRGVVIRDREPMRVASAVRQFFWSNREGAIGLAPNEHEITNYRMDMVARKMNAVLERCASLGKS